VGRRVGRRMERRMERRRQRSQHSGATRPEVGIHPENGDGQIVPSKKVT